MSGDNRTGMKGLVKNALRDATLFPFWLDSRDAPPIEPQLIGKTCADLVIVGGGFTGLWAAILAKEASPALDVVLVEAGKVANGASGRPGGIVSTSVMHGLSNAVRVFPKDIEFLERLGHENMQGFRHTLQCYDIDCQDEWNGELTVAIGQSRVSELDEEYRLHLEYGHEAQLLGLDAIREQINSPLFHAGVWSKKNSGIVHPARLAWGLKKVALQLGVRLHEISPMTDIAELGNTVLVKTHDGEVKAPRVLLATNAFAAGHPQIRQRVAAIRDRIIATQPLTNEQLSRVGWVNRQGLYDTRTQLNYTRLTKDNRIIFGGRLGYCYGNNTDPAVDRDTHIYERLASAFFTTFPQLQDVRFSHAWGGPIALTTRMAVHFQHYFDKKMVYAGGYSGFGISASRLGARVGLDILNGVNSPECNLDIVKTMPNRMPGEPFRYSGAKITMYALDTADEHGGWRNYWLKLVGKMGFPLS